MTIKLKTHQRDRECENDQMPFFNHCQNTETPTRIVFAFLWEIQENKRRISCVCSRAVVACVMRFTASKSASEQSLFPTIACIVSILFS